MNERDRHANGQFSRRSRLPRVVDTRAAWVINPEILGKTYHASLRPVKKHDRTHDEAQLRKTVDVTSRVLLSEAPLGVVDSAYGIGMISRDMCRF